MSYRFRLVPSIRTRTQPTPHLEISASGAAPAEKGRMSLFISPCSLDPLLCTHLGGVRCQAENAFTFVVGVGFAFFQPEEASLRTGWAPADKSAFRMSERLHASHVSPFVPTSTRWLDAAGIAPDKCHRLPLLGRPLANLDSHCLRRLWAFIACRSSACPPK